MCHGNQDNDFGKLCLLEFLLRGDTHMTSTLRGGGGKAKMRYYRTYGVGVRKCSGRTTSNLYFFLLKEIGFGP